MADWDELPGAARERYEDGAARLPDDPDARQKQLTRMGNAAGAAGLTELMAGRDGEEWFARAAERYRESWEHAPPGAGAGRSARSRRGSSPATGTAPRPTRAGRSRRAPPRPSRRSAATRPRSPTACSASGTTCASTPTPRATHETFPSEVADALAFIAAEDVVGYVEAVEDVLESFETREEYLEDMPVADTVLVLQALAGRRGMAAELESELLP